MATITFDTLKFAETLKAHGIPDEQAKGIAAAFRDAAGEADLASKRDIEDIRNDIRTLEYRLTTKLGTFIMLATGILIAVVKL